MAEIRCPPCGEALTVDETEYAQIVKQVRDAEFEKDIAERVELVRQGQANAVEAAVAQANVRAQQQLSNARASLQGQLAEKDALIAKLRSEVEQGKSAVDVARLSVQREADAKLAARDRDLAQSRQRIAELEGIEFATPAKEEPQEEKAKKGKKPPKRRAEKKLQAAEREPQDAPSLHQPPKRTRRKKPPHEPRLVLSMSLLYTDKSLQLYPSIYILLPLWDDDMDSSKSLPHCHIYPAGSSIP